MEDDLAGWHRREKRRAMCNRNRGAAKAAGALQLKLRQENRRLRKDSARAAKAAKKTIAAKDAEIAKLKKENRRLGERLRQLRASTSWRLTAPLRWIVSKIRK